MTALADIDDLQAAMQRDLATCDQERAPLLLAIASAKVRTCSGVNFTRETTTVRVRVRHGKARLPQGPVIDVSDVNDMDGNHVSFEWFAGRVVDCNPTLLNSFEVNLRRGRLAWVDVTYTHGYDPVPADVVGVVCDMVATALDSPPEQSGIQSEQLGPFSMSTGSAGAGGVQLTQTMKDTLANYMTPVGTAAVS